MLTGSPGFDVQPVRGRFVIYRHLSPALLCRRTMLGGSASSQRSSQGLWVMTMTGWWPDSGGPGIGWFCRIWNCSSIAASERMTLLVIRPSLHIFFFYFLIITFFPIMPVTFCFQETPHSHWHHFVLIIVGLHEGHLPIRAAVLTNPLIHLMPFSNLFMWLCLRTSQMGHYGLEWRAPRGPR